MKGKCDIKSYKTRILGFGPAILLFKVLIYSAFIKQIFKNSKSKTCILGWSRLDLKKLKIRHISFKYR